MSRVWFRTELETVATFWRIQRRDGIALGFATHDRDLWFDGVLHRAAPGMVPSAIRKSAGFDEDSVDVGGALGDDGIAAADIDAGRFDDAVVLIGLVDWETLEAEVVLRGTMGAIHQEDGNFTATVVSRKAVLERDLVPRTSPTCRAAFCGPGCNLNPEAHALDARIAAIDADANAVTCTPPLDPALFEYGTLRWLEGPQAGLAAGIVAITPGGGLVLDLPLGGVAGGDAGGIGAAVVLRQGCDRTLATCRTRFANAINFRGEPFLPGNDLLSRYPGPAA